MSGVYAVAPTIYAATDGGLSISADCVSSSPTASSASQRIPGTYKIVMTGAHRLGHQLVLTNYLTGDDNGGIVSVSAESQQPLLN